MTSLFYSLYFILFGFFYLYCELDTILLILFIILFSFLCIFIVNLSSTNSTVFNIMLQNFLYDLQQATINFLEKILFLIINWRHLCVSLLTIISDEIQYVMQIIILKKIVNFLTYNILCNYFSLIITVHILSTLTKITLLITKKNNNVF